MLWNLGEVCAVAECMAYADRASVWVPVMQKSAGGVILPEASQKSVVNEGTVVEVGPGFRKEVQCIKPWHACAAAADMAPCIDCVGSLVCARACLDCWGRQAWLCQLTCHSVVTAGP